MASGAGRLAVRRRWVTLRRVVQITAFLGFLLLLVAARHAGWPPELVNAPMRLDPLAVLAHLLASREFLAGSALALVTVALTLGLGRVWCGWLCPLGTVLDWFGPSRNRREPPPEAWRGVKHGLLLTVVVAALLGNLTLLVLDPLTLLFRTLSAGLWPGSDQLVRGIEAQLYAVPALREPVAALDEALRPELLPVDPAYYRDALLFVAVLAGVIALSVFARRFWCRYLCPLGGMLGLFAKVAPLRRTVVETQCNDCGACARVCPTGTIRADKGYASDPAECTVCLECLPACPRGGNTFALARPRPEWNEYDPGRRHALVAMAAAVAGVALLRTDWASARDDPRRILPPGARENDLLAKCIRCGECIRTCPTSGLQPARAESGSEGVWTPVLVPRNGYCDYSCNACGQICPVQAIPPLSLDDKRERVIGLAYLDEDRCLAWSDHIDCIVCEEMCPLPEKAVWLEQREVEDAQGAKRAMQLPHVDRARCIGCGICEYKCPVAGPAAIQVFVAPPA